MSIRCRYCGNFFEKAEKCEEHEKLHRGMDEKYVLVVLERGVFWWEFKIKSAIECLPEQEKEMLRGIMTSRDSFITLSSNDAMFIKAAKYRLKDMARDYLLMEVKEIDGLDIEE